MLSKNLLASVFISGVLSPCLLTAADQQLSVGPAYVGTDPIGPETFRVGGSARFIGDVVQANSTGINLAANGAYFGINTYYSGGWKSYTASPGGAVIRNSAGTLDIITGTNTTGLAGGLLGGVASRLVITPTGNVGISVTSPTALLSLPDAGNATLRVGITDNRSNAVAQILESLSVTARAKTSQCSIVAGDVNFYGNGTGTTWAGTCLYYYGSDMTGNVAPGITQAGAACLMGQNANRLAIGVNGVAPIQFFNGNGEQLVITGNGNVGIGITSPTSKLAVGGSGNVCRFGMIPLVVGNPGTDYPALGYNVDYSAATNLTTGLKYLGNDAATDLVLGAGGGLKFRSAATGATGSALAMIDRFVVNAAGNVGIGVASPTSKLAVAGTISASEVKVTATPADYVFAEDYKLRPLSEVEVQVKEKRHLPGVPSAQEQIQAGSVSLSEMQRLHLEKIEELTLYAIQADKRAETQAGQLKVQAQDLQDLREVNRILMQRLDAIERQLPSVRKALPASAP